MVRHGKVGCAVVRFGSVGLFLFRVRSGKLG